MRIRILARLVLPLAAFKVAAMLLGLVCYRTVPYGLHLAHVLEAGLMMPAQLGKPRGGQFKDWLHALTITPDGKWLAAGDMVGAVQVWTLG